MIKDVFPLKFLAVAVCSNGFICYYDIQNDGNVTLRDISREPEMFRPNGIE
jgi:hypothetical protein